MSTYPPRHCGIATFTHDLALAVGDREIVAIVAPEPVRPIPLVVQKVTHPLEIHHRIARDEVADHVRAAHALARCVDVVSIQYEQGIWGGDDGENVLDFVRALDTPAVATLHTVQRMPSPRQRAILVELVSRVEATVVMSRSAAALLTTAYGIDATHVEVIHHGVPDLPLVDPATMKPTLGLDGRRVLLSYGLLGPGKGYELAIDALPAVAAAHPDVLYVIVGATHPDLLLREGEAYREALVARVAALRMGNHVRFFDRFVGRVELTRWLEAADVFVAPYPNLDQIVSGTLSYAMGAGRAIVSTPFTYAAELLADGRGVLVPAGSPALLAAALIEVLGDDELRASLGRHAYEHSRPMAWSEVAVEYRRLFRRVGAGARATSAAVPSLRAATAAANA